MAAGTAHSRVQATVRQGTARLASTGAWAAATTANGSSSSGISPAVSGGVSAATNKIAASPQAATASDATTERCLRHRATGP